MNSSIRNVFLGALVSVSVVSSVYADDDDFRPGYGMHNAPYGGYGMMGPGMMGPGMMGPGMMGPGMGGYGMMGPGMMGPGMGGYGMMGPGMGGYGMMGPGYAWNMQGLSDEQLRQMREIRDQSMKQQREIMRKMWDEQVHLQDLLESDDRDPEAISEVYGRIAALRQKALKQHLIMENRMEKVLGKEQRAQMRRNFHERMMGY